MRQIFLSKLKLRQTRQTSRKNMKQSKAEIGYEVMIVPRNSQINSMLEKRAFLQKFINQKLNTRTTRARSYLFIAGKVMF